MPVNDTVVGVVGVLVIVGSLAGAISLLDEGDSEIDDDSTPAALDQTRWSGEACRSLTMIWSVDAQQLSEHVDPWSPQTGSGGQGAFHLTAWTCGSNTVNNTAVGGQSGAFALVPVEEPEDPRNVSREAWFAVPEVVGDVDADLVGSFERHGFPSTAGSASVEAMEVVTSRQVSATVSTDAGQIDATALLVAGSSQAWGSDRALVAPGGERFVVASGSVEGSQQEASLATVETSGETWVDRLGLDAQPDQTVYSVEEASAFSLWDRAFQASPDGEGS